LGSGTFVGLCTTLKNRNTEKKNAHDHGEQQ